MWLVSHIDVKRSARVRTIYDLLATGLTDYYRSTEAISESAL